MKRPNRKDLITTALCWAVLSAASTTWAAGTLELAVFHTNDVHGWMMARPDSRKGDRRVGGLATVAKLVNERRETGKPTLLLDAGDFFQGTPEGTIPRGRAMVELFNAMKFDAVEVGNHEFDYGEETVKTLAAALRVPFLGANVESVATGGRVDYLADAVVKEFDGVKVGIFGILTAQMRGLSFEKNIAGLRFAPEIETARKMVAKLKGEGATVIIALTHAGFRKSGDDDKTWTSDQDIASAVPGIDLLVGGHSHTFLSKPHRDPKNGTLVVQAGGYLKVLGEALLTIDRDTGRVVSSEDRLIDLLPDETGEDPEILEIVKRYESEVGRQLDAVIGRADDRLDRDYDNESALGDWMTDCGRKWTKTQLSFQNSGGIRADLPKGDVTLRSVFQVMPFDNYLVTLYMTGRSVKKLLDYGLGRSGGVLQVSGVRFTYDRAAPKGSRVSEAMVGRRPLDEDEVYSVSAPDFIVQGGDDYSAFAEGTDKALMPTLVRDALVWCVRTYSPVRTPAMGRVRKI